jgi:hypothetical protein
MGRLVTVLSVILALLMLGPPSVHAGHAGGTYRVADTGTGDSGTASAATSGNATPDAETSVNAGTGSALTMYPPSYGRFLNERFISDAPGSTDSPSASPRTDSSTPASPKSENSSVRPPKSDDETRPTSPMPPPPTK